MDDSGDCNDSLCALFDTTKQRDDDRRLPRSLRSDHLFGKGLNQFYKVLLGLPLDVMSVDDGLREIFKGVTNRFNIRILRRL